MVLPDMISVEDFFRSPARASASISPDGTRIAFLAPWKNRLNVWIQDLESDSEPRCVTADETRTVQRYSWTDDPRFMVYLQDDGGDENWHVHRVDLDDPEAPAVDLTPFPGAGVVAFEQSPSRPGKAIVALNARDAAEFDLHELDIATGELTVLVENPGGVIAWLYAGDGRLFARTMTAEGDIELCRFDTDSAELHPIAHFDGADHIVDVFPFELTPDGTGAWIGSNRGTDRTRLVRLDLATGAARQFRRLPQRHAAPRRVHRR